MTSYPNSPIIHIVPQLPLKTSQIMLRQWEQVCPQNSAQVILVEGSPDPELIESAWQSTLRDLGLGRIHLSEEEPEYSHEIWSGNPPAPLVSYLAEPIDVLPYVQSDLNRPFPNPPTLPYRAFAVQQPAGCYLGIVYQQWVADSISVRILLREWFLRIFFPDKARRRMIDLPRPKTTRGPATAHTLPQYARAIRTVARWIYDAPQFASFALASDRQPLVLREFELSANELHRLNLITQAEGFTLNDLMIACTARTLQKHLPRKSEAAAWKTAVATSIDLRPYLPGDLSETFGNLLAYAPVVCELPRENLLDLAQEVARQTRRLKDPDRLGQRLAVYRFLTWWTRNMPASRFEQFMISRAPVPAIAINVNLNKSWAALYHPAILRRYLRFATPNPATPLAISASILGDTCSVVISVNGALGDQAADAVSADFAQTVRSLIQSDHP